MYSLNVFKRQVVKFNEWKTPFIVKKYGSCREILINRVPEHRTNVLGDTIMDSTPKPKKFFDTAHMKKGIHICRMVRLDIEKRLKNGALLKEYHKIFQDKSISRYKKKKAKEKLPEELFSDNPPIYELEQHPDNYQPQTIYYNFENIKKSIGKEVVAIDISSCYFNTAFFIGAIGERVHKMAFKQNREWKEARNISIGTLGKRITFEIYNDGRLIDTRHTTDELSAVRTSVLKKVDAVSRDVFEKCFGGWLMFLTDCFFVLPEYAQQVKDILREYGYDTKQKRIVFTDIKHKGLRVDLVHWRDIIEPEKKTKKSGASKQKAQKTTIVLGDDDHKHYFNVARNQFTTAHFSDKKQAS